LKGKKREEREGQKWKDKNIGAETDLLKQMCRVR
jgi:hypothetical protein